MLGWALSKYGRGWKTIKFWKGSSVNRVNLKKSDGG